MSLSLRTPSATAIIAIKAIVFVLCLLPAVNLALGWQADALGANPIETITRASGEWTLRLLLITLAVTPLRRLTGLRTAAGAIRVVEMRPLTPRATLALVAVRDREYLLAVGQSGATLIAQVRGEADPGPPDFQAVLAEQEP